LISKRKMAEDKPAEPNIIHMTIIWYLAAMKGETPERI
jgi:hypothetical protein